MALTITAGDVKLLAPELTSVDDTVINRFIAYAADEISGAIGSQVRKDRVGVYLVAHLVTQWKLGFDGSTGAGAATGSLVSVTVGPVSKHFAAPPSSASTGSTTAELGLTRYGREFLRLIRIFTGGSWTVSGGLGPAYPLYPWI